MQGGILGKALLTAETPIVVWVCPDSSIATININFCNLDVESDWVSFAIVDTVDGEGSPVINDEDYLERDSAVVANGVLERSGIVVSGGDKIVAYSKIGNTACQIYGVVEEI